MHSTKSSAVKNPLLVIGITIFLGLFLSTSSFAKTAKEIDTNVNAALDRFRTEVKGADEFLKSAKGMLVLPGVIKGGFVVGGEYGEGALRIKGKTVDYYSIASASYGFQLGGQKKDVILIFMQEEALQKFRESSGWKAGVDGSVALVNLGAAASIDTAKINEPIVGFVFSQKGLMYNLTLEGSKFTKLKR
ncbi:MAG: BPSL1445 family SYLF domain-containing lipoprotein [Candidatus Loosdrechtia sp.]|uniref:lipid-binding SYLF domain-containing protein n=1 Tax=Candidatus Loosdrechtia sp. TaxID=3101272 RepID=UPI003A64F2F7|nr:MAG: YSC84-related protein [Candidatus Jettenia sp. AMX2]